MDERQNLKSLAGAAELIKATCTSFAMVGCAQACCGVAKQRGTGNCRSRKGRICGLISVAKSKGSFRVAKVCWSVLLEICLTAYFGLEAAEKYVCQVPLPSFWQRSQAAIALLNSHAICLLCCKLVGGRTINLLLCKHDQLVSTASGGRHSSRLPVPAPYMWIS